MVSGKKISIDARSGVLVDYPTEPNLRFQEGWDVGARLGSATPPPGLNKELTEAWEEGYMAGWSSRSKES